MSLRLFSYLFSKGVVTEKSLPAELDAVVNGIPGFSGAACKESCTLCQDECPTEAIKISKDETGAAVVSLDRAACINCARCLDLCPTGTIVPDREPVTAALSREGLLLHSNQDKPSLHSGSADSAGSADNPFKLSVSARVVSTGCSACDLEISAAGNPIFDMERFGVHVVASPRFADVLMVTGPVPKAMHDPLKRCYEAMAEPRRVIAVGTCACSGGIHKGGYAQANGAAAIIPVDVFIPGCPPHPWSIIAGVLLAMDRLPAQTKT